MARVIKVHLGKQGSRGVTGEAAPETIAVAGSLASVVNVSNNIAAVNTVADNIVDVVTIAASLVAIVRSLPVNVIDFGAIGDGLAHPLSSLGYATLAEAQVVYPQATSLADELDGTALRKAIAYCVTNNRNTIYTPPSTVTTGYYRFNTLINFPHTIGARSGCINFIGDLASASRKYAATWVKTGSTAGFRFIGTSLAVNSANYLIPSINMRNITVNGGWALFDTNADYPVIEADAGYEFIWENVFITSSLGGVLLREVMDSRFDNVRITWCGQRYGYKKDMSMTNGSATVTVSSTAGVHRGQRIYGTGVQTVRVLSVVNSTTLTLTTTMNYTGTRTVSFESKAALSILSTNTSNATSNNQVWSGLRIENGPGPGIRLVGQNVIDIDFNGLNKVESNEYSLEYQVEIDGVNRATFDNFWCYGAADRLDEMEYAITTSGKTLAAALAASLDTFTIPGAYLVTTGVTTAGSKVITGIPDTTGLFIGQSIDGAAPFNYLGNYITSVDSSTQVTMQDNATTSGTKTITFSIYHNYPIFYFKQLHSNCPVVYYDTTDPRNYALARVVNYTPTTGVVDLHVLEVFGDTSKSITSWKLSPVFIGMASINNASNVRLNINGGGPDGSAPAGYPYMHSFVTLKNTVGYVGDAIMNSGNTMLPANTFKANRSTSTVTVGTGNKSFMIETGLPADYYVQHEIAYVNGGTISIVDKQMVGPVVSYNSGTGELIINVTKINGSGSASSWKVSNALQPLHLKLGTNTDCIVTESTPSYRRTAMIKHITELTSEFKDSVNAFTMQQYTQSKVLIDAANISWNLDIAQNAVITLEGNRTLDNPTNMKPGAVYSLLIKQDATGSRTLAYGSNFKWIGGVIPVLSTTADAVDLLVCYSDGTNLYSSLTKAYS